MSDKQSSDSRDERPSSFDVGALASLFEHAGVGYDREEDRPFSLRPAPFDTLVEADEPMNTSRDPNLEELSSPDTEVEFLDDRPTDRPPPSDEPSPSSQASEDGPELTDPGALPPA